MLVFQAHRTPPTDWFIYFSEKFGKLLAEDQWQIVYEKNFPELLFCKTSLVNCFWHVNGCFFWVVLFLCFSFYFCLFSFHLSFSVSFLYVFLFLFVFLFSILWWVQGKIWRLEWLDQVTFWDSKFDTLTIIWSSTIGSCTKTHSRKLVFLYWSDIHSFLHPNCHH